MNVKNIENRKESIHVLRKNSIIWIKKNINTVLEYLRKHIIQLFNSFQK